MIWYSPGVIAVEIPEDGPHHLFVEVGFHLQCSDEEIGVFEAAPIFGFVTAGQDISELRVFDIKPTFLEGTF